MQTEGFFNFVEDVLVIMFFLFISIMEFFYDSNFLTI